MKVCLKNELTKMFCTKIFWVTLLISIIICSINIYENFIIINKLNQKNIIYGYQGINLFVRWINVNMDTLGYVWFFFLFPLIAVMPYSWSLLEELSIGYAKNIVIRSGRYNYIISKYLVVFVAGGIVIAIPLTINLLLNALICPACVPDVTSMTTSIWNGHLWSELFYTKPWLFSWLTIFMDFLFGGAIACLAMSITFFTKKKVIILLIPILLFVILDYIINLFTPLSEARIYELSPLKLLHASTLSNNPSFLVFGVISILLFLSIILCLSIGKKDELL